MRHPLDPIVNAKSVAIVGASRNPQKRGHQAVRRLLEIPFQGTVHPVHPDGGELLGLPVATSVTEIDPAPDLACLYTPAATVPGLLEECGTHGIRGAVVTAVGFGESGDEGAALETRIREIVRGTGIRVVGPNTSGILNTERGLNLVGVREVPPGGLGLLAQSGNIALETMRRAKSMAAGISVYVGVGNETDIGFHEVLDFLGHHDPTRAVVVYLEGARDGPRFLNVAERVVPTKPVVVLKGGRTRPGAAAARSHTGALTGTYASLRAVFRQTGITVAHSIEEMVAIGVALADQPPIHPGRGLAILSDGGGHGTLAADLLAESNVGLAQLSNTTRGDLGRLLGSFASVANPIDLAGAADRDPSVFTRAVETLAVDPGVGGILVVGLFGGYAIRFSADLGEAEKEAARAMSGVMTAAGLPLVVHTLYADAPSTALDALRSAGVPVVGSLDVACHAAQALDSRGRFLDGGSAESGVMTVREAEPEALRPGESSGFLPETEVRAMLETYGANLVPAVLCRTEDEVAAAIEVQNGPVAIRAVSAALPHKREAGGVVLGIGSIDEGQAAFRTLVDEVGSYLERMGDATDLEGALVSPMAPPPVAELLVGARRDRDLGPIVTVGSGGTLTELLGDVSLRRLPVTVDDIEEMIGELRVAALLDGYRGGDRVEARSIHELVLAVARCLLDHEALQVLEVNPAFVYRDRTVAIDVKAATGQ